MVYAADPTLADDVSTRITEADSATGAFAAFVALALTRPQVR
jgi:hypothetical protein